jgi:hypothetical protein
VDNWPSDPGGISAARCHLGGGGHSMTLFVILGIAAFAIGFVLVGWWLDKRNENEMVRLRAFHNRSGTLPSLYIRLSHSL